MLDCAIIGAGPAGLTAATYLARFHRKVIVFDGGPSRASWIPCSHNHAGFPGGVSGNDLLARMRDQAEHYGATIVHGRVDAVSRQDDMFTVSHADGEERARAILFATGVVNRRPPIAEADHQPALDSGTLRYCPICDGYEVTGKRVAVLGSDTHGVAEALFLRSYSDDVTLLTLKKSDLDRSDRAALDKAGIAIETKPASSFEFGKPQARVRLVDGRDLAFDTLYPALGSDVNDELLVPFGLKQASDRSVITDSHMRLGIVGLYAAGDLVRGLDQISVAMGQAAIAATAIHNDLRERDGETLERK
jgi:thioredoxin reductase (NADPH)